MYNIFFKNTTREREKKEKEWQGQLQIQACFIVLYRMQKHIGNVTITPLSLCTIRNDHKRTFLCLSETQMTKN